MLAWCAEFLRTVLGDPPAAAPVLVPPSRSAAVPSIPGGVVTSRLGCRERVAGVDRRPTPRRRGLIVIRSPRRRLTAIAAMGALAVGALAGCRTDAGSAAYVGNTRITTTRSTRSSTRCRSWAPICPVPAERWSTIWFNLAAVQKYATAKKHRADAGRRRRRASTRRHTRGSRTTPRTRKFIDFEASVANWCLDGYVAEVAAGRTPTDADLHAPVQRAEGRLPRGHHVRSGQAHVAEACRTSGRASTAQRAGDGVQELRHLDQPAVRHKCTKAPCASPTVRWCSVQGAGRWQRSRW